VKQAEETAPPSRDVPGVVEHLFRHEAVKNMARRHRAGNAVERFEGIEAKLDELRSYLYANRESVRGYAEVLHKLLSEKGK
jgi:hypothetical protein